MLLKPSMLSKVGACAHPSHIVERVLLEPQELASFIDSQERILMNFFHVLFPFNVNGVDCAP